jgi:hypothetical protein
VEQELRPRSLEVPIGNEVADKPESQVIRVRVRVDCSKKLSKLASASRTWRVSELAAALTGKGFMCGGPETLVGNQRETDMQAQQNKG